MTNDAKLIAALGGPTALARRLGYKRTRVQMWASTGVIPAAMKLKHPALLMPGWKKATK